MSKKIVFDLYRYQIIPISKQFQMRLDRTIDYKEVIKKKNILFKQALLNAVFVHRRKKVQKSMQIVSSEQFYIVLGKELKIKVYDIKSNPEEVNSYPPTRIFIDNNPERQLIAVERNGVFSKTESVIKMIFRCINNIINNEYLTSEYSPLYNEGTFWNFVHEHSGDISYIKFIFITPNMSNISDVLSTQIKQTAKNIKAAHTEMQFSASQNASLSVDDSDENFNGLVEYTARGCGSVKVKAKSLKKCYLSGDNIDTIEAEHLEISGDLQSVFLTLRELTNGNSR